ncbi:hypothetical protein MVEN_01827900 [Mycena venus]|uniref:Yeast cell wall synthesis Kre9/Knh1-like N-terminal domain-containing protein n=1 Tax=Mycena venus TaxID=2733690 RepID=A0A8H6XKN2_9AGAR|nr:hypothetical protein MVEN_01827900 [Mycena venus]
MLSSTRICAAVLAFSGAAVAVSNLQASPSPTSGGHVTLTWSSEPSDTSAVTLVMYSTNPTFNGPFAIANNINPQDKHATVTLPDLMPASGYSFGFVSMSDTSKVVATSPEFAIPAPGPYTTPAKPTVTSSHIWSQSSMKPTPASVAQSAASAASHSGSSAAHISVSASVSRSIVASLTVPFPSASASSALSHTVVSFTSAAPSIPATTAAVHSSTVPSASTSARTGGALLVHVPVVGLAVVIGGLLVGAWAV